MLTREELEAQITKEAYQLQLTAKTYAWITQEDMNEAIRLANLWVSRGMMNMEEACQLAGHQLRLIYWMKTRHPDKMPKETK